MEWVCFLIYEQLCVPLLIWWQPVALEQIPHSAAGRCWQCAASHARAPHLIDSQLSAAFIFPVYIWPLLASRAGCRAAV